MWHRADRQNFRDSVGHDEQVDVALSSSASAIPRNWRFGSEAYPKEIRFAAWQEAMGRLGFAPHLSDHETTLHGTVTSQSSPLGVLFAQIASGAQEFMRTPVHGDDSIMLVQHVDGEAFLREDERSLALNPGDLMIAGGNARFTLAFATPFRQVVVRVPRMAVNARMFSLKLSAAACTFTSA